MESPRQGQPYVRAAAPGLFTGRRNALLPRRLRAFADGLELGVPTERIEVGLVIDQQAVVGIQNQGLFEIGQGMSLVAGHAVVAGQIVANQRLFVDRRPRPFPGPRSPDRSAPCACGTTPRPARPERSPAPTRPPSATARWRPRTAPATAGPRLGDTRSARRHDRPPPIGQAPAGLAGAGQAPGSLQPGAGASCDEFDLLWTWSRRDLPPRNK